jgi:PAS domain S-box-containing protein
MHWTPYVLPHLAAAAGSALTAGLIWRRRHTFAAQALLYLAVAGFFWAIANTLELASSTLDAKTLWAGLQYPAIESVPVLWFAFALYYTGQEQWLTRRRLVLLAVIPVITVVLMATNSHHGLMRYDIALDASGPFSVITKKYGPWFYLSAAYAYALLLVGTGIMLEALIRWHHLYRMQGLTLLAAILLPTGANVSYVLGFSPIPQMDLTPPAFAISGMIIALGMMRYQTLDLVPAARNHVVDSIGDGVLVLDERGRILDLNPAGARLLGCTPEEAIGRPGADMTAEIPALCDYLRRRERSRSEIAVGEDGTERCFDVAMSALTSEGRVSGWVVVLRDMTDYRRVEREREALIVELQGALANIRTLRGLIPICACCKKVRDDKGYWRQVEEYVRAHSEADFTHAICPECMQNLYPEMNEEP